MTGRVRRILRLALGLLALGAVCAIQGCDKDGVCGDGVADTGEECDGEDVGGADCQDLGYETGELSCYFTCTYVRTDCATCGNNHKELREECDGPDLGGVSCDTLGYYCGTLGCRGDCEFDRADCAPHGWCGDGVFNGDEECDDSNDNPWDGCTECSICEFRIHVDPEEHGRAPALTIEDDGSFVVVWEGGHHEPDSNTQGIYGRKFHADGSAVGVELRMSENPEQPYLAWTYRTEPDVAGSGSGRFAVVWRLEATDANIEPGLYGQVFDQYGSPSGLLFRIDQGSGHTAERPKVAMADDGHFAVVWQSHGLDSAGWGIGARIFDRNGVPTSDVMVVNSTEIDDQILPQITMDGTGGFTVVWQGVFGSYYEGVFAQWFNVGGTPVGTELEIGSNGISPAVDTTRDGTTMIVWTESCADLFHWCLWAQTFDSTAMALDPANLINEHPDRLYGGVSIALRNDGSAILTWVSRVSGGIGDNVYFQILSATDTLLGTAQPTHTYSDDAQTTPHVETDASGAFVITWESQLQDEHGPGIYAQRYNAAGTPLGRNQ